MDHAAAIKHSLIRISRLILKCCIGEVADFDALDCYEVSYGRKIDESTE